MAPAPPQAAAVHADASEAFKSGRTRPLAWRLQQIRALSKLLRECEGELCHAVQQDLSKPPFETFATEIGFLLNACELALSSLKDWMKPQKIPLPIIAQPASGSIVAEPLGVVLIFSAWNFPLMLALEPLIGALAGGNAVVLKPSEIAPAVSSLLAKLIPLYMDGEAIKVIEGGIDESENLLQRRWDKIFFTGNTQVGKIVMAAAAKYLTPVTLELGGKCPTIIDSTTDFEVAARRIAAGKWAINSGQACVSPDYILVEKDSAQKLIDTMVKILKEFFGLHPETADLSRIVNARHFSRIKGYLQDASTAKSIVHGGQWNENSLFIEPTILLDPPLDAAVMTEEIFGPVLPIVTLPDVNDAIDFVNSREKPLALYVFSNNEGLKRRLINETSSGALMMNDTVIHSAVSEIPFGGVGNSGMGASHGKTAFENFSHMKPVLCRSTFGDTNVRYPPYTPSKQSILRRLIRFKYFELLLVLLGLRR